jgi:hypothetical protein
VLLIWAVPLCTALAAAALLGMFLLPQFVRSQPMGFGYESILDNLVARVEVVAKIPECDFEEIKIDPTTATRFKSTAGGTSKLRNFLRSRRHSLIYLDHLVIGKTVSWIARSPRKWHQARRISLWEAKREIRATQHPHKYEWVKLYLFWFLYLGILSSLFISVARYASKMDEEEQRPDSEEVSSKDVETITRNAVMNEVRRTRKALDDDLADQSRIDVEEEKNRETGLSIYQRKPNQLGKIAGTYLSYRKFTDSESMVDNRKELIYFGKMEITINLFK